MKPLRMALFAASFALVPLVAQAQDVHVVSVVLKDGSIAPTVLEVPAGKRIKIMVSNDGTTPIEFESKALKFEKVLAPGAKSSVVINPLKPGEYGFFDEFHPEATGKIVAR
jgi:hypothetical protein